jgi:hypothetical protein
VHPACHISDAVPASLGTVLTVAAFSPASTHAKLDFPVISVEALTTVVEPLLTQLQFPTSDNKVATATPRKRRGKSMTRRRGQDGSVETSGRWRVVRFWIDVPGQDKGSMHADASAQHLGRGFSVRQHRSGVHVKSSPNPVLIPRSISARSWRGRR